jgi:hypothetical protein
MNLRNRTILSGVIVGVGILLGVALLYALKRSVAAPELRVEANKPEDSPPQPKPSNENDKHIAAQTQPETERPKQILDNVSLDEIAQDVIEEVKALDWPGRVRFDGKALYFSAEDLEKAKRIVSRYFDNFSKIRSVTFKQCSTSEVLDDTQLTRSYAEKRIALDNSVMHIKAVRNPMYLKITGTTGDGKEIDEVVTPAGKLTSGHIGFAESFIPTYLDGERWFFEYSLLKAGDRVREDVVMDLQLSILQDWFKRKDLENTRYDAIEDIKDDVGLINTYWFNRETGMLDFLITTHVKANRRDNPIYSVLAIDYYDIDGTYYFKNFVCYDCDFQIKHEENITDLVLEASEER